MKNNELETRSIRFAGSALERRAASCARHISDASAPTIIGICCEPGMGSSLFVSRVLSDLDGQAIRVLRRDLAGYSDTLAADYIVRTCRAFCAGSSPAVLVLDHVPALDEGDAARAARAIDRLWQTGRSVLMSFAPEAVPVFEQLPQSELVLPSDLLEGFGGCGLGTGADAAVCRLTRGIASLVDAVSREGSVDEKGELSPGVEYIDRVERLVTHSLRLSLTNEELRLRLAMLLLGQGTRDDLARVLGERVGEGFMQLARSASVFGANDERGTFRCLNVEPEVGIRCGHAGLAPLCVMFPEVASSCAALLYEHEEYARATVVYATVGDARSAEALADKIDYVIDAGFVEVARHAAESGDLSAERTSEVEALLDELAGKVRAGADAGEGADGVPACPAAHLLLRAAADDPRDVPVALLEPGSDLDRRLSVHLRALGLLAEGRFEEVLRLVAAAGVSPEGDSLSGDLVGVDEEFARLMLLEGVGSGGPVRDYGRWAVVARPGYERAGLAVRALRAAADAIDGASASRSAEVLVAQAERMARPALVAVGLLAGCVCDLRAGSPTRARVRASLARTNAERAGCEYLGRVSTLFEEVAGHVLGEEVRPSEEGPDDDLGLVSGWVRAVLSGDGGAVAAASARADARVPRNALWVLWVLSTAVTELVEPVRSWAPGGWGRPLPPACAAAAVPEPDEGAAEPDGAAPVRLCLLGRLDLTVRGRRVDPGRLEYRSAKSVLAFLALQHGSAVRRYRIVEQVWPDSDYAAGFNRVYQATTTIRSAVGEVDPAVEPFVTSRASRTIGLDPEVVSCDVDDFVEAARLAADGSDDRAVVEGARRAEALYEGDLYVPPADATGCLARARRELAELYCDAMVAGAESALRIGQRQTSTRMAYNAIGADDLREDAMAVLVRALRSSGRDAEAERTYRRFSERMIRTQERPPSRRLRQVASGVLSGQGSRRSTGER